MSDAPAWTNLMILWEYPRDGQVNFRALAGGQKGLHVRGHLLNRYAPIVDLDGHAKE